MRARVKALVAQFDLPQTPNDAQFRGAFHDPLDQGKQVLEDLLFVVLIALERGLFSDGLSRAQDAHVVAGALFDHRHQPSSEPWPNHASQSQLAEAIGLVHRLNAPFLHGGGRCGTDAGDFPQRSTFEEGRSVTGHEAKEALWLPLLAAHFRQKARRTEPKGGRQARRVNNLTLQALAQSQGLVPIGPCGFGHVEVGFVDARLFEGAADRAEHGHHTARCTCVEPV